MQDGAGVVTYLTRDHLGSIREQVGSSGSVVLRRDYDPWGNLSAGASIAGWAFTGRENEPEVTGFYHRARYYRPTEGHFLTEDPAADSSVGSLYAYVANNPIKWVDPLGLVKWQCDVSVGTVNKRVGGGGGTVTASCESDCVGGRRVFAVYFGPILGLSFGPFKAGASNFKVDIYDDMESPWAVSLAGVFGYSSGGVTWGTGKSCSHVVMGHGSGYSCDASPKPDTGGIDIGVDWYLGGTYLLYSQNEVCACR
jgi:RHS repeat-associated protein